MFHKNIKPLPSSGKPLTRQNAMSGIDFLNLINSDLNDLNSVIKPGFTSNEYQLKTYKKSIYISFYRKDYLSKSQTKISSPGWKLHINLQFADLNKAWSLIIPILKEHQINVFKVSKPTAANLWQKDNSNFSKKEWNELISQKELTIYQQHNQSKENWEELINTIENTLAEHNIRPGRTPLANHAIINSQYFTYRNDTHPNDASKYISDTDAHKWAQTHQNVQAHNPSNAPNDPFENIEIKPFPITPLHRR